MDLGLHNVSYVQLLFCLIFFVSTLCLSDLLQPLFYILFSTLSHNYHFCFSLAFQFSIGPSCPFICSSVFTVLNLHVPCLFIRSAFLSLLVQLSTYLLSGLLLIGVNISVSLLVQLSTFMWAVYWGQHFCLFTSLAVHLSFMWFAYWGQQFCLFISLAVHFHMIFLLGSTFLSFYQSSCPLFFVVFLLGSIFLSLYLSICHSSFFSFFFGQVKISLS